MGLQQIYSGHVLGECYKVIQAVAFREGARAGRDGLSYHRHLALVIKVETPYTYPLGISKWGQFCKILFFFILHI